jgi:hypothetical protein
MQGPSAAPTRRYLHSVAGLEPGATSPLPWMFATIGLWVAMFALVVAAAASGVFDEGGSPSAAATGLGFLAVMAILGAAVTGFVWVRQIGKNSGRYGGLLVLGAIIPWERLAFSGDEATSVGAVQGRVIVSLVLGLIASLAFRRKLIVSVWRSGRLEPPFVADLIWLMSLIGWALIAVPLTLSVMDPIEERTAFYVTYRFRDPNPSVVVTGLVLSGIAVVAWLGTLIAATVAQHKTITEARRVDPAR